MKTILPLGTFDLHCFSTFWRIRARTLVPVLGVFSGGWPNTPRKLAWHRNCVTFKCQVNWGGWTWTCEMSLTSHWSSTELALATVPLHLSESRFFCVLKQECLHFITMTKYLRKSASAGTWGWRFLIVQRLQSTVNWSHCLLASCKARLPGGEHAAKGTTSSKPILEEKGRVLGPNVIMFI